MHIPCQSLNSYMKPQRVLEQGEEKNETEIPVFFFLVPWENAESSFEDSVVKKIMKNISYTL